MTNLLSMLRDTRLVAALLALIVICTTVLVAMGRVDGADAVKVLIALLTGAGLSWFRGEAESKDE